MVGLGKELRVALEVEGSAALTLALHRDLYVLPKVADSEPSSCPKVPLAAQGLLCLVPRVTQPQFLNSWWEKGQSAPFLLSHELV